MFMFLDETATAAEGTQGNSLASILSLIIPFALIAVVFYFFLIRPQKKQEKEAAQMRDALQVGDEVTTIGGIIGRVVSIKDETFTLETSRDRTKMRFLRSAIKSVDVRVNDLRASAEVENAEKKEISDKDAQKKIEGKKSDSKKSKKKDSPTENTENEANAEKSEPSAEDKQKPEQNDK